MSGTAKLESIISNLGYVRELAPGLYTALPEDAGPAPYDRRAAGYDAVLRWALYQRFFWGTSPSSLTRFGREALDAALGGNFAEIGCGSLLFTARMYEQARGAPIILIDRSIQMLRRGLKRLNSIEAGNPDSVVVLHADATALPVRSEIFGSILSLNLVHVPCDRVAIVAEFRRMLTPGRGRLFLTSLIRSGRWSDRYMAMLHRAGEFGDPLTLAELRETVAGRWGVVESAHVEGNMCFLVVRHAG